jgi:hypothetical protein
VLADLAVQFPARVGGHPALSTSIMGAQSAAEVDGFVRNWHSPVSEATWADLEAEWAQSIQSVPVGHHFYYVKPAAGHVLWNEMAQYDEGHSVFVGEGTAEAVLALRSSASQNSKL